MKRKIFVIIMFVVAVFGYAQDATTGKLGLTLTESAFEKPGLTMFNGTEFELKNTVSGGSVVLQNFSNYTGSRISLAFGKGLYTVSPFMMAQLFVNLNPKINYEDGVYQAKKSDLIMRTRAYWGVENKFKFHDWATLGFSLTARLQADFDPTNETNKSYFPEIYLEPMLSLNGFGNNFSYFVSANCKPYWKVGSPDVNQFNDIVDSNISFSLGYDLLRHWVTDEQYNLTLYTNTSLDLTWTKDDELRSHKAREENALGYSGYKVESFLGAIGKIDRIQPLLGLWLYSKDSQRINDKIVNDTYLGVKGSLGFTSGRWSFIFEYKGGGQVNKGAYDYRPERFYSKMGLTASMRL